MIKLLITILLSIQVLANDLQFNNPYDNLFDWLRKGKADVDKVEIVEYSPGFRGLRAKVDIRQGEWVVMIPKTHFLFLAEVKKTCTINRKMIQLNLEPQDNNIYFVNHMLQESKRKNSFWQPYLQVLPQDVSIFPAKYTQEELNELQAETTSNIRNEYYRILDQVPDMKKHDYDDFLKFKLLATSRSLPVVVDNEWVQVLVPVVDMINHDSNGNLMYEYNYQVEAFVMIAQRYIRRGEELFINYGQYSGKWFLVNYGFTSEQITMNQYDFTICEDPTNPLKLIRTVFYGGWECHNVMIVDQPSHFKSREALSIFRIKSVRKLNHWLQIEQFVENTGRAYIGYTTPISESIEKLAWEYMETYLTNILYNSFPTTIEQDQELLRANLSYNMRSIVNIRLKEKEIILLHIETARLAQEIIYLSQQQLQGLLYNFRYSNLHEYIAQELLPFKQNQ